MVPWTIKKCWEDYGSLHPDKQLVVFYTEREVGQLLGLLGIPCANATTTFRVFDPYFTYPVEACTCQFDHKFNCSCQATLAQQGAKEVYDILITVDCEDAVDKEEDENDHDTSEETE